MVINMFMYIYSWARSNADTFRKIEDASEEIIVHLIKVFLFPNVQERNHWKKEIWSFLPRISKLKSTNKFPTDKQLCKALWNSYEDVIFDYIPVILEDMEELPITIDRKCIYYAIQDYMKWLATELSQKGIVSNTAVSIKIESIQNKYTKENLK